VKRIAFCLAGIVLTNSDLHAYVGQSDAAVIEELGERYELTSEQRVMTFPREDAGLRAGRKEAEDRSR